MAYGLWPIAIGSYEGPCHRETDLPLRPGAVVGSILRTIGAEPRRKRRRQFAFLENFFRRFALDQEQQAGGPLPVDKPYGREWAGM
jgi:hypothetical protein